MPKYQRRIWTPAEKLLLREHYADSLTSELALVLGRKPGQVHQKARKLGLAKSAAFISETSRDRVTQPGHGSQRSRFQKGIVPANKGMRHPPGWAPGDMARIQFKKGHLPHTWVPVGSYTVNADGYLDRKISEEPGPRHVRWKPVHRLVWEEVNGPVPDGHVVVFKPGRFTTDAAAITLDVVELITRRELMARNTVHNLPKQLVQIVQLRAVLNRKINQRSKA